MSEKFDHIKKLIAMAREVDHHWQSNHRTEALAVLDQVLPEDHFLVMGMVAGMLDNYYHKEPFYGFLEYLADFYNLTPEDLVR